MWIKFTSDDTVAKRGEDCLHREQLWDGPRANNFFFILVARVFTWVANLNLLNSNLKTKNKIPDFYLGNNWSSFEFILNLIKTIWTRHKLSKNCWTQTRKIANEELNSACKFLKNSTLNSIKNVGEFAALVFTQIFQEKKYINTHNQIVQ